MGMCFVNIAAYKLKWFYSPYSSSRMLEYRTTSPPTVNWNSLLQAQIEKQEVNKTREGGGGRQCGWSLFRVCLCLWCTLRRPHSVVPTCHISSPAEFCLAPAAWVMRGWVLAVSSTHCRGLTFEAGDQWFPWWALSLEPPEEPREVRVLRWRAHKCSTEGVISMKRKEPFLCS